MQRLLSLQKSDSIKPIESKTQRAYSPQESGLILEYVKAAELEARQELSVQFLFKLMKCFGVTTPIQDVSEELKKAGDKVEEINHILSKKRGISSFLTGYSSSLKKQLPRFNLQVQSATTPNIFTIFPIDIQDHFFSYLDRSDIKAVLTCKGFYRFFNTHEGKRITNSPKCYSVFKMVSQDIADAITTVETLPDGSIVYGFDDGHLRIMKNIDGKITHQDFAEHKSEIVDCQVSADKTKLITCSRGGGISIRDIATNRVLAKKAETPCLGNKILSNGKIAQIRGQNIEIYECQMNQKENKFYLKKCRKRFPKNYYFDVAAYSDGYLLLRPAISTSIRHVNARHNGFYVDITNENGAILDTMNCPFYPIGLGNNNMIIYPVFNISNDDAIHIHTFDIRTKQKKILPLTFEHVSNVVELPGRHFAIADWSGEPLVEDVSIHIFRCCDGKLINTIELDLEGEIQKLDATTDGKLSVFTKRGKLITIDFAEKIPALNLSKDPLHSLPRPIL
jgi:WD40 repeat protein